MTEAARARWDAEGWLALGPLLDASAVGRLREEADALVDAAVRDARYPSRAACVAVVNSWPSPWRRSEAFRALLDSPGLWRAARALTGLDRLRLFGQQLVVKPARDTFVVPWHRDRERWPADDRCGITVWIALDDVPAEAGALRYLPGSHRHLAPPGDPEPVVAPTRAGEALVHHADTWHASAPNRTDGWRRGCVIALGDPATPRRAGEWDEARWPVVGAIRAPGT